MLYIYNKITLIYIAFYAVFWYEWERILSLWWPLLYQWRWLWGDGINSSYFNINLTRDQSLSIEASELLASRFIDKLLYWTRKKKISSHTREKNLLTLYFVTVLEGEMGLPEYIQMNDVYLLTTQSQVWMSYTMGTNVVQYQLLAQRKWKKNITSLLWSSRKQINYNIKRKFVGRRVILVIYNLQ